MTKIDIISGFLGAGKTTLIKKLLADAFKGQKVVLVENEFGEIGVDGGFLKEAGVQITELNAGCICCSLVGDFKEAITKLVKEYAPDRILIEPSGVGKLSDIIRAVQNAASDECQINLGSYTAVVDAKKAKMYMKNFGEFFNNQVEVAQTIILSRTQIVTDDKLNEVVEMIKEKNPNATIITTPWDQITGEQIFAAMEKKNDMEEKLLQEALEKFPEEHHHHHHHHHHDEDEDEDEHEHHHHHDEDEDEDEHEHHHHHDEDEDEDEHEHHHHHHDEDEDEDEHEHHHHHDEDEDEDEHEHHHHHHDGEECDDENCSCHHHHDHDADEVFQSVGIETPKKFDEAKLDSILKVLSESYDKGTVLRAKGVIQNPAGEWIEFDLTPGEYEIRKGAADVTGKIVVIGSGIHRKDIKELFEL